MLASVLQFHQFDPYRLHATLRALAFLGPIYGLLIYLEWQEQRQRKQRVRCNLREKSCRDVMGSWVTGTEDSTLATRTSIRAVIYP